MTLPEILAALAEYVGEDASKAKEVARELRNKNGEHSAALQPVATALMTAGAGKKSEEFKDRISELTEQVNALSAKNEELQEQVETAKAQPTEQAAAWDREKKKLADAREKAEKERDAEREGRATDAVELSVSRFLSSLKGRVDDFGLDAVERRYRSRFRAAKAGDAGLRVEVLDAEGEPIEAPKGRSAEDVLADEAFEQVPSTNRVRTANSGAGGGMGGAPSEKLSRKEVEEAKEASGAYRL
jgi:hypothetical protein